MKFIDVSGIGNSGKSAVVDFLREIEDIHVPNFQFEFDLIRTKDGLLDLRNSVNNDWSPVRSGIAYKLFTKKVMRMGIDPKPYNIFSLYHSLSTRYERFFKGKFFYHTNIFLESLVIGSYKALWPFEEYLDNKLSLLLKKLISRLGYPSIRMRDVLLIDSENFDINAQIYLKNLFLEVVNKDAKFVVLNNGIEPFNPVSGLSLLGKGSKQIVVLRDPRDIYVSGKGNDQNTDPELLAPDNDGTNKSFLASDNIDLFIKRHQNFCKNLYKKKHDDILIIWFEDLVLNCKDTQSKILDFLKIDLNNHTLQLKHFDPKKSDKSVMIWKKYSNQDEISEIAKKLNDFLYTDNNFLQS